MKIRIFLGALLLSSFMAAQQPAQDASEMRNELKVNLLMGVLEYPEFSYERLTGQDGAVGVSIGFAANKDIDYRFFVMPYYRVYFGKVKSTGFFLEVNSQLASVREWDYIDFSGPGEETTSLAFGMGAAAGGKFLSGSGWIGEVYIGVGRYFQDTYEWGYPRVGITVGRRFK
ncbi:hypothetical protein OZ410_01380 [Robiginitalea sp. M366]|uniref:hypothetical protein n=1 Tax=Robiginitalea aestuariiviva TaxID=3036903 RepID=UPI00240E0424|nr:hypothetical protein [Robiginitalea aestuariiviva]MDG1570952.1 hypothetical protein [Robiginitalea aestuariiviva]